MTLPTDHLGDVINLVSSSDESALPKKRSLPESDNSQGSDNSMRRSKRARKNPKTLAKTPDDNVGTEEGEIDDEPQQDQAASAASGSKDAMPQPDGQDPDQTRSSGVFFPANGGPIYKHKAGPTWAEFKLPVYGPKREGNWDDRFRDWAQAFCTGNVDQAANTSSSIVLAAYGHYLENNSGIKGKKKRNAKQAGKAFMEAGSLKALLKSSLPQSTKPVKQDLQSRPGTGKQSPESDDAYEPTIEEPQNREAEAIPSASEWASLLDDAKKTNGHADVSEPQQPNGEHSLPNGAAESPAATEPIDDHTMEQLRKYFPSATDLTNLCLLCGRKGHMSANCSSSACKFCGSIQHWHFSCPTRSRCGKCRQLGHSSSTCEEKLALTKAEGLACSFCSSADHLEDDCTEIWRSFVPDADSIHTVAFIAPSCSQCGSGQHYSSDCAQGRDSTKNPTWSLSNRDRYIDRDCQNLAIEDEAARSGATQKSRAPEIRIRGHASRTNNVIHYSSDDSDVEFLGNKRPMKRAPLGQIRMASNIQMPSDAGPNRARNDYRAGQPPLPPGPPPPGPPGRQGSFGRPPPSNPASLPAKPPPASWAPSSGSRPQGNGRQAWQGDDRNASSGPRNGDFGSGRGGQRGGRGGRGGRGRGRGRGKQ